jgi:pimeloyl-ACP methyl ester carboxylesterase
MFKATSRRGTFSDADIELYKDALKRRGSAGDVSALTAGINYYRANVFSLATERMSGSGARAFVDVPTLFIYGEQDAFVVPETVRDVGSYVAALFREVRLPRAGHWVQQEYPNEVSAALLGFLNEGDAEKSASE